MGMKSETESSSDRDLADDLAFREQCRRQMARSLESRMKYGFCRVYRPILDDVGVRSFESTKAYREWCAENLPAYLGFQPATDM
jgi:hypothetical protein